MRAKVTWRCNNPFVDLDNMAKSSVAEIEDNTAFDTIEGFAIEATPENYHLHKIETPDQTQEYTRQGERKQSK